MTDDDKVPKSNVIKNSSNKLSKLELHLNLALFLMAGYETSSATLTYILHVLASYPEEQQKLFDEIQANIPKNKIPNYEETKKLVYMDYFIKEVLRMYPVANA